MAAVQGLLCPDPLNPPVGPDWWLRGRAAAAPEAPLFETLGPGSEVARWGWKGQGACGCGLGVRLGQRPF